MSQQINLFDSDLVKSKDWFTLPLVLAVYALVACVMFYLFTGLEAENAQLQVQRDQASAQYEAMQKKVAELSQRVTPVDNTKLEAALKNLKARFEMQSQILAIFQQSISDSANHLVDYMRALTAQQQSGLWLTGFRLEPAAQHVTLLGQALQSEDIPAYLDLLSAQRVFEGTQFSGLQFKQVELKRTQTISAAAASPATAPAPAAPIAPEAASAGKDGLPAAEGSSNRSINVAPAPATAAAPAQALSLNVYTFEVKGQDMQSQAKRDTGLSWDEFVHQTTQPQAAARP